MIVAANGGSDLVYLADTLSPSKARRLARALVRALVSEDYVSGLFVDEARVGAIAGALSTRSIEVAGSAVTPHPAIVVNFQSFTTGCEQPTLCTAMVADTILQQGQGMHGSFSRADTWNFMAARGPDFRTQFVDHAPTSNADIGMTIAKLLDVTPMRRGQLVGRVLSESFRGNDGAEPPAARTNTLVSRAAADGLKTTLKTQSIGSAVYFDAAGFTGRTVGLEAQSR